MTASGSPAGGSRDDGSERRSGGRGPSSGGLPGGGPHWEPGGRRDPGEWQVPGSSGSSPSGSWQPPGGFYVLPPSGPQAPPPRRRQMPSERRTVIMLLLIAVVLLSALEVRHVIHISSAEIVLFACLVVSIILHEVSHGWVALAFGDDTAKRAGRLTLDPISHIDPFGTIILPAILVLLGAPAFGWAKPVPVNVSKLRHPRNDGVLVALAGPAMNAVLATIAGVAFHLVASADPGVLNSSNLAWEIPFYFGFANVLLGIFNLLPIPPLDGSALLERALPERWLPTYYRIRMRLIWVPILLFLLFPPIRDWFFTGIEHLWINALGI